MQKLINDLLNSDNEAYHADSTRLSSSNIKQILKSPRDFYQEKILGNYKQQPERDVFSEGSFTHTLILEADKVSQYAVYPGLRKQGAHWEDFKAANKGKTILSMPQVNRCESWAKAALSLAATKEMLKSGIPEHTMLGEVLGVPCKARADWICPASGFIMDVKTTSSPPDKESFSLAIEQYEYALSAALYCELARQTYGKLFNFYFLAISKQQKYARIYKASSDLLSYGTARMTKGLVLYKKCKESNIWDLEQPNKDFSTLTEEIEEV